MIADWTGDSICGRIMGDRSSVDQKSMCWLRRTSLWPHMNVTLNCTIEMVQNINISSEYRPQTNTADNIHHHARFCRTASIRPSSHASHRYGGALIKCLDWWECNRLLRPRSFTIRQCANPWHDVVLQGVVCRRCLPES
jgi:hypothetical protein